MEGDASDQSAARPKVSITVIACATVGGVVLVMIVVGFLAIIRRQNKKLKALKDQPLTEPSAKLYKQPEASTFAMGNTISELDGVDTLRMNPELDASVVYELPANEAVGSELYSPARRDEIKSASLRQRELEHRRRARRLAQSSQRRRFIRDDPQFEFNGSAQTVSQPPPPPSPPPLPSTASDGAGRLPLTRAWSSPDVSPGPYRRQRSDSESFESPLGRADTVHELPRRSQCGSI